MATTQRRFLIGAAAIGGAAVGRPGAVWDTGTGKGATSTATTAFSASDLFERHERHMVIEEPVAAAQLTRPPGLSQFL